MPILRNVSQYVALSLLSLIDMEMSRDDLESENDYEKPGSESSGVSSWKSWQEADAQFRVRSHFHLF